MPKMSETDWLEGLHIEDNSLTSEILENEREAREEDEGGRMSDEELKSARLYAELFIDAKGEAHLICHTKDDDFLATKEAFGKFIGLLQAKIAEERRCPFYVEMTREAIKEPPFVRIEI